MSDEMNDLERATEILNPLIDREATEDEMVIELIQSGFKFSRAGRLLTQVLESKGLRLSAKDRYAAVEEHLVAWSFDPQSWADVEEAAESLSEEVDNTSKAQAIRAIQKFAKQNGIELPAKPKGTGGGGGPRVNAFDRFASWAMDHRDASDEDIDAYALETITKDGAPNEKQAAKYSSIFKQMMSFARDYANA